jgi:hypothetical protein
MTELQVDLGTKTEMRYTSAAISVVLTIMSSVSCAGYVSVVRAWIKSGRDRTGHCSIDASKAKTIGFSHGDFGLVVETLYANVGAWPESTVNG